MAATLPLSLPLFTSSRPQSGMDQDTAEKLNDQIDEELKVRKTLFILTLRVTPPNARESPYD